MKIQKFVSIAAIIISLTLIIYMCVVMFKDSSPGTSATASPGTIQWASPTPASATSTESETNSTSTNTNSASTPGPSQTLQNTATPAILTTAPTATAKPTASTVTAVPGGKTSTNPNYEGKKLISITFDDGPHNTYTPQILDMLKAKNVNVTFFLVGQNLLSANQKDIIKRAASEGHELASHSYSHADFAKLSADEITEQLSKTDNLIREATGITPILFRPPYGSYNQFISQQSGKALVLWSIDSRDWDYISAADVKSYADSNNVSEEEAKDLLIENMLFKGYSYTSNGKEVKVASLVSQLRHGSIILFHDIHPYACEAVSILIDYLQQSGEYEILTVSEMIETEQPSPKAGDVYRYMWETFASLKQNW